MRQVTRGASRAPRQSRMLPTYFIKTQAGSFHLRCYLEGMVLLRLATASALPLAETLQNTSMCITDWYMYLLHSWGIRPMMRHALASPCHHRNRETGGSCWPKLFRLAPGIIYCIMNLVFLQIPFSMYWFWQHCEERIHCIQNHPTYFSYGNCRVCWTWWDSSRFHQGYWDFYLGGKQWIFSFCVPDVNSTYSSDSS